MGNDDQQPAKLVPCIGCGTHHDTAEPCPDGTKWEPLAPVCMICSHRWAIGIPDSAVTAEAVEFVTCPKCDHRMLVADVRNQEL